MNTDIPLVVVIIVAIPALIFAWNSGTRHPSRSLRRRIAQQGARDYIASWCRNRTWTCTSVDEEYPGFMGCPTRVVVLESGRERYRLQCHSQDITVSSNARLRPRTDEELSHGTWVSAIDEYMHPEPLAA